ncbi:oxoglutarate dehydrogenase (succinyl-transferring), E1 component, partial [Chlamydia psittaci 08DC60]
MKRNSDRIYREQIS